MEENEGSTRIHRRIDGMIRGVKTGRVDVETAVFVIIEGIAEAKAIKEMQYFLGMAPEEMCRAAKDRLEWIKRTYNFRFSGPYLARITKEAKEQRDRELEPVYAAMHELCQEEEKGDRRI